MIFNVPRWPCGTEKSTDNVFNWQRDLPKKPTFPKKYSPEPKITSMVLVSKSDPDKFRKISKAAI